MRFTAFSSQSNCVKTSGSRILNFCPENFLWLPKVKKKILKKNFLTLEGCKKFSRQKFNNLFQIFIDNLAVSRMPQTASRYLKNCRRRWFSRKHLLFQQKLATLQTGNSVDFHNILNRPSNRCLWWGYEWFWGYLNF